MNPTIFLHHYLIENAPRFILVVTIRTQAKELKTTTQAPTEMSPLLPAFKVNSQQSPP